MMNRAFKEVAEYGAMVVLALADRDEMGGERAVQSR